MLVLAVAALASSVYVALLVRQAVLQAQERAVTVSQQVFFQSQNAMKDAATAGLPLLSNEPEAVREYVRTALDQSAALTSMIEASLGYSPTIYEITITDLNGVALVSSDATMPGRTPERRTPLSALVNSGFIGQLRMLYGPPRILEYDLPFNLGPQPFGEIRVSLNSTLLQAQIDPALRTAAYAVLALVVLAALVAALVSHVSLAPVAKISAQLDRISKGEMVPAAVSSADEFGQVSSKISQIGQQLHGVQEIFSTLRENVKHVMEGIDDGLILFTHEGAAVMVSPAVEKYLGAPPENLIGKTVPEVFPPGHPLRVALKLDEGRWQNIEPVEVRLNGGGKASRVIASMQSIAGRQAGESIGALVTLRDVESIEQLDSHLQVSEHLSALGKVTAGVAHEVKNPLNSMRLWLENLKQTLPAVTAGDSAAPVARQAVQILDAEIDRLDRVVKTFLDFSKPVDFSFQEIDANELVRETAATFRPQFAKAGVRLDVQTALEPLHIHGDTTFLKQALVNLTLNALQAISRVPVPIEPGRVALSCRRHNGRVRISVEDNGPGIPPEQRQKVFQLFFSTQPGGSGIGLASAYRIVQLHQGMMEFETEVGRGTTFWMDLPSAD